MWMIFLLILLVFFLLSPFMMFLFPLLLIFLPVLFFAGRPSVKVYTRTFTPDSEASSPASAAPGKLARKQQDLSEVIDVEYTEHDD